MITRCNCQHLCALF